MRSIPILILAFLFLGCQQKNIKSSFLNTILHEIETSENIKLKDKKLIFSHNVLAKKITLDMLKDQKHQSENELMITLCDSLSKHYSSSSENVDLSQISIDYTITHNEKETDAIICYIDPVELKTGYYGIYVEVNSDNIMHYSGGFIGVYEQNSNQITYLKKVWK